MGCVAVGVHPRAARRRSLGRSAIAGGPSRRRALRWSDIDLGSSEIRVERSWDRVAGPIEPKSEQSIRTLPLVGVLRDHLDEHKLATERGGADLAFGRTAQEPFAPPTIRYRARAAWKAAGPEPITLHECRHTFASLLIDAGENPKAIQAFMGHATIQMTFDRYGHLMPGSREQARVRLDAYLASSSPSLAPSAAAG